MVSLRGFLAGGLVLLATPPGAEAQQAANRIGYPD
jgi:hypothetical protein